MDTIRELWDKCATDYADLPAVRWLNKKIIEERSYGDLADRIIAIRKGLFANYFTGKHIALIGTSSVEWVESYLAVTTGQNVAVPLDANLPHDELIELLERSDAEAVFLSPKLESLSTLIKEKCSNIRKIWILEEIKEESKETLADLIEDGKSSPDVMGRDADDVATIIFTSGTTGKSKGVMLSQRNLASNVDSVILNADPGTVMMSVLPIHHAFCLVMDWLKGFSLGSVVCINDSYLHMVRNMSIFHSNVVLMVPLMIETIYKKIASADKSIPSEVIANTVFGGNLDIIFTGGAHLDPFYIEKFAEYGVSIHEGYGMSECSPVISSNNPENYKYGSIGRPLPNVEIAFDNGEILVRGSSVMLGYYKMPEETASTLKDGWLHTGDKGYIDEDGYLFINGRVKNLIIMSNGENVSPEEIENKLALNDLAAEVIVTGENNSLTARIYPDQELALAKGMDEDDVREALQKAIDEYNQSQPSYRHVTGLVIRKNPFIRNTTGKIKRQQALIDEIA